MKGIFNEKQVYPFWVVVSIGIILAMSPIVMVDFFEENPKDVLSAVFLSSAVILFVALFFLIIKLKVRIDDNEIRLKFIPFFWKEKSIKWEEIKKAEVRKSKSIREFGGWGYRVGKGKRAYTLYGHWVIDITFKNDKHLFIGTQKHCEIDVLLKKTIYLKYPGLKPDGKSQINPKAGECE